MASNSEQRIIEIIVNSSKAQASLKDMKAAAGVLYNQISKLTPGTEEFIQKTKQLQEVRGPHKRGRKRCKRRICCYGRSFQRYEQLQSCIHCCFAAFSLQRVLEEVINFGMKGYELAKIYSEAFASIVKSTGMTK